MHLSDLQQGWSSLRCCQTILESASASHWIVVLSEFLPLLALTVWWRGMRRRAS